ncbi:MAG TPA: hypothetical protein VGN16_11605 [Acidobacteriaceae bacterium]
MSSERIQIYRDFLQSYTKDSESKALNISQVTKAFHPDEMDGKGCLKGFRERDMRSGPIHQFGSDAFDPARFRLINPALHKKSDPGDAIRRGENVDDAVEAGVNAGVFTFSEIIFNATHTRAAFSFSFVCGGLCGHGWTVIYKRTAPGGWRQSRAACAHWIS